MIQRIQSIYLLIIVILMVATMFMPLAMLQEGDELFYFDTTGLNAMALSGDSELIYPSWGLFVLTALIALIAMVTIFLYKRRILQIRLCIFNALLILGFYGLFVFLIYTFLENKEDIVVNVKIALGFPLINLILDYLAIRNIGADEALVRSLERLR